MTAYLLIFVGCGLGGLLRHAVGQLYKHIYTHSFPLATLTVNVVGSFLIGLIAGLLISNHNSPSDHIKYFLMTGVMGGFTTFSSFSLETIALFQNQQPVTAAVYIIASVMGCLAATAAALCMASN